MKSANNKEDREEEMEKDMEVSGNLSYKSIGEM